MNPCEVHVSRYTLLPSFVADFLLLLIYFAMKIKKGNVFKEGRLRMKVEREPAGKEEKIF